MDAADAAALLAPLRPWLGVFMRHASSCRLKNRARTDHGVIFRFHCEPIQDEDERAVAKVREAIDLVYRALALHTSLALHFGGETHDNKGLPMSGLDQASITRQLLRDTPFEMQIFTSARQLEEASQLKRKIADELLVELTHTPSTDAAFLEARSRLDALLEAKNPRWADALTLNPMKLKCFITTGPLDLTTSRAEEFFVQLAAFTNVLDKYEPTPFRLSNHLPLSPKIAVIRLTPIPISPAVATIVSAMTDMQRAKPKLTYITIDPRLVTCSRDELCGFLRGIQAKLVELLPAEFGTEEIVPMDLDVDVTPLLQALLTAISDCETVTTLDIGGLLMLCTTPRSRTQIFQVLVGTIMTRAKALNLCFDHGETGEIDGRAFTSIARHWKTENPEKKLRLKQLFLGYHDLGNSFINAILDDLDEVEELAIVNRDDDAPHISTQQVADLLRKFRTIRELTLGHVDLDSMRVFSENAPPTLQSLSLIGLRLDDRQSMLKFFEELSLPERPLARQLRRLSITKFGQAAAGEHFLLGELEVARLEYTLRVNRVLQSVQVYPTKEDVFEYLFPLDSAEGSVIPAPPDVRLSGEEKARRVAFLSVLHGIQAGSVSLQRLTRSLWDSYSRSVIRAYRDSSTFSEPSAVFVACVLRTATNSRML